MESFVNGLVGFALGVVTGLISGVAVARWSRFNGFKRAAHKLFGDWEYMSEQNYVKVTLPIQSQELRTLASDMGFFGHTSAFRELLKIANKVESLQKSALLRQPESLEILDEDRRFQETIRHLRPNWRAILLSGPV